MFNIHLLKLKCPFCEKEVKALPFHVNAECRAALEASIGKSNKFLSEEVEKAVSEAKKKLEIQGEAKQKQLAAISVKVKHAAKSCDASLQSDYQRSIFYSCGAIFRGDSLQVSSNQYGSGSGGFIQRWISESCKSSDYSKKERDAEMKVISEIENKLNKQDDLVVILGGEGPCNSCRENIKAFASYHKIQLVTAYLTAPYKTTFDNKEMWYGSPNDEQVDGWYVHLYGFRKK